MIRNLPAALLCLLPLTAQAQTAGGADLICFSVGGNGSWTQVAVYGADDSALVMALPPEGDGAAMESQTVTLPDGAFNDMILALLPGLAAMPAAPEASECADDALGPVSIAVRQMGAEPLRYDAPCTTQALLDLNDTLIAATGDPSGEDARAWTGTVVPALRDICRALQ
ncbi:hypothetical protein [Gymnodinialimonas hymeniacidonis]|uniref:hypothetical protein n=1 Tax=Gymnodinialimonas hymeniacidonis TaxID=3126508 RepID=UPI0034C68164